MKYSLALILPCILAACAFSPDVRQAGTPTPGPERASAEAANKTKLFSLTGEVDTITALSPKNDLTQTVIVAGKIQAGTEMAETLTAQPTPTSRRTLSSSAEACIPASLKASVSFQGATGNMFLALRLINMGSTECYLPLWPQVILVDPAGSPLNIDYRYWDMNSSTPQAGATEQARSGGSDRLGLLPGQSAGFSMLWSNWCGPSVAGNVMLRLTLGGGAGAADIPTDLQAGGRCDAPGSNSTLSISAFQPEAASP